jgi:hypothetical protein
MSKSVIKLFRDPQLAAKAAEGLKSKGFKDNEIGILVSDAGRAKQLGAKVTTDIGATLAKLEGLSEEAAQYYEGAASIGAVLISVTADDKRLNEAQGVMREAEFSSGPNRFDMWSTSPGFPEAEKMSATNPLDAKMSGDFRKY